MTVHRKGHFGKIFGKRHIENSQILLVIGLPGNLANPLCNIRILKKQAFLPFCRIDKIEILSLFRGELEPELIRIVNLFGKHVHTILPD